MTITSPGSPPSAQDFLNNYLLMKDARVASAGDTALYGKESDDIRAKVQKGVIKGI